MWCSRPADRPRLEGDRGAIDARMPVVINKPCASLAARSAPSQVLKPRHKLALLGGNDRADHTPTQRQVGLADLGHLVENTRTVQAPHEPLLSLLPLGVPTSGPGHRPYSQSLGFPWNVG